MHQESDQEELGGKPAVLRHWSLANLVAAGVLIGLSVITVLTLFLHSPSAPTVSIPASELNGVGFGIYLPRHLPNGYKLDTTSFKYVPSQKVFVFSAKDGVGDSIAFTEQAKPGVDFSDIYQKQFVNSSNLEDVPYPSTIGSTLDRQTSLLSIVTQVTWILATTNANLGQQDFATIASSLYSYSK